MSKSGNLNILKKHWFLVPSFTTLEDDFHDESHFIYAHRFLSPPYIIRSSFSGEDSKSHAFAGIFESFFPIYSKQEFQEGIKNCLDVKNSDKVHSYCSYHNIDISSLVPSIIVQDFIVWDWSWVCFTNFDSSHYMRFEIVPGINTPLVSWSVGQPFTLLVSRNNHKDYKIVSLYGETIYHTIIDKKVVATWYEFLDFEDNIILHFISIMAKRFQRIEDILWCPQDIEFTVKDNDIYILQSRPIT